MRSIFFGGVTERFSTVVTSSDVEAIESTPSTSPAAATRPPPTSGSTIVVIERRAARAYELVAAAASAIVAIVGERTLKRSRHGGKMHDVINEGRQKARDGGESNARANTQQIGGNECDDARARCGDGCAPRAHTRIRARATSLAHAAPTTRRR